MRDMEPELKPCPFCGGNNLESTKVDGGKYWFVLCYTCDTEGPTKEFKLGAADAWNTRHEVTSV